LNTLHFPVLLKRVIGHSGEGIVFIRSKEKLQSYLYSKDIDDYIFREFVSGYDLGCYVLYDKRKLVCYTLQRALVPGKLYQISMSMEFFENKKIINMVDQLMQQLHWNGFANIENIEKSN
jgi:predicted ATP-grasp superfamily ATP-dependent carboligase